jgi:diguanylate cyclase (GGDEF)-like protein/PAS domain S-box-containing protein
MGTYSRLFIPIFLLIAVVVCVRYSLMLGAESDNARASFEQDARQTAAALAVLIEPIAARSDRGAAERLLAQSLHMNEDLEYAQWTDAAGHVLAQASNAAPAQDYPAWLPRLAGIEPFALRHEAGGGSTLLLWFRPELPLSHVWHALRQQAALTAMNVALIYLLLGLLIWANHRMLRRLAAATSAFQEGQLYARLPVRGSMEARAMARTFNGMAARVQQLLTTLQGQKERIAVTLASIGDAVATTGPSGAIESMNPAAERLAGLSEAQARGQPLHAVFEMSNNFGPQLLQRAVKAACHGGHVRKMGGQTLRRRDGDLRDVEYTAAPIREEGEVRGAVLVFRDVSENLHLMQRISWQSQHDVLTGLPNRTALAARFEHEIAAARSSGMQLAVCLFDLDDFGRINAQGGQALGDEVLKQAASRLHDYSGQHHYVARLGGDEFVMLLPQLPDQRAADEALRGVLAALQRPCQCGGQTVELSACAGVALFAGGDISADGLLRRADQALYQAKLQGQGKVHFFDAGQDEQVRTHHNRRAEVRAALQKNELCLHYQPKVDMREGRVTGMEALLRWRHPQRGIVPPLEFLPYIEHTDLVADIGEWVLREALRQLSSWCAEGQAWTVSVNIAARHFQRPDFTARLRAILSEFPHAPPQQLELEVLESSALHDVEHVRAIMRDCQAFGIRFALDDFGTGYASMPYLKRLPAETLKIDQSFVRNMLTDGDDRHLVCAVIGLAQAFGRTAIAEGVETVEHGVALLQLGCRYAQGYGIARPMPPQDVAGWAASYAAPAAWRDAAATA